MRIRRIVLFAFAILAVSGMSKAQRVRELQDTCATLPSAAYSRHVFVIYDMSLSYQHNQNYGRARDTHENFEQVRRIGLHTSATSRFSFGITRQYKQADCGDYDSRDVAASMLETYSDGPYDDTMNGGDSWMGKLDHLLKRNELRLEQARAQRNKPPMLTRTDIEGALRTAVAVFRQSPRAEKYIVIFSDLDNDPFGRGPSLRTNYCEPLDLHGVVIVVANFGRSPGHNVIFKRRTSSERKAWLEQRASAGHAKAVCYDWNGDILHRLNLE